MSLRPTAVITAAAAALAATLMAGPASASRPPLATHWSASWASAMQQPVASSPDMGENWSMEGFSGQTVRQEVRISGGGNVVRIRLSNLYGTKPLRLAAATVAESAGGPATEPGTMRSLTFRGSRSVTIAAGQVTASDAVGLHVAPLESLTATLYFAAPTGPSTFHEDGLTTTYQATGDHARDSGAAAFDGPTSHSYYYLTGVDVATRGPQTVVAFGDSITNGHNSSVGGNDRYTDALAERLLAEHSPLSVANAGITGNLLLHQLPCFGETGITRFERDALYQPGARTVILITDAGPRPRSPPDRSSTGSGPSSTLPTPAASGSLAPPSCRLRPTTNPPPNSSAPKRSAKPSTTGSSAPGSTTPSPTSPPPSPTPPTRSSSTPATTPATTSTPTTPATGSSQRPSTLTTCDTA